MLERSFVRDWEVGGAGAYQALLQLPNCCARVLRSTEVIKCGEGLSDTGRKTRLCSSAAGRALN